MNITDTPRVWIACLASYNAGRLVGEWVDATDIDNFTEAVERIKKAAVKEARAAGEYGLYFPEPEEFAIHDYDNFPGEVVSSLGEYPDWEKVVAIATAIEELGEQFTAWLKTIDNIDDYDSDRLVDSCQEQCVGAGYDSEQEYAMERSMELGLGGIQAHWPKPTTYGYSHDEHINIIDELSSYIDWETVAREMFDHGTLSLVDGYVFDSEM